MTVDVIRYSGDLKIATAPGGIITLDTGVSSGTVVITGNLNILGTATNIASTNTVIKDNIITLNAGESGTGVSLGEANTPFYGQAGFVIDRGTNASTATRASVLFEERAWSSTSTTATQYTGIWALKTANRSAAIEVGAIRLGGAGPNNDNRLNLLGAGITGMLSVAGQQNYHLRVLDDNDIPNKYYVDNTPLRGTATTAITALELKKFDTRITITDGGESPSDSPGLITTVIDGVSTMIVQRLAGVPTITLGTLVVAGNTLRSASANRDLVLETSGTGTVVVNNGIGIGVSSVAPQPAQGVVKIYTTSTVGAGSTGIKFSGYENLTTLVPTSGELISARKALVLSIIF
jgi:hypothetical protein